MLRDAGRAATLCPPLISEENLTLKNAELEGRMKPIPSIQRRDEERAACSEILRLFSYILHHISMYFLHFNILYFLPFAKIFYVHLPIKESFLYQKNFRFLTEKSGKFSLAFEQHKLILNLKIHGQIIIRSKSLYNCMLMVSLMLAATRVAAGGGTLHITLYSPLLIQEQSFYDHQGIEFKNFKN